ncbi:hypothetical protein [Burkholderia pseudomallei]|uniref:hypothetical protein n=1 Tax=Burkholderia pseudomallei TaxID=28450 RepID=UPI0019DABC3B|nr:hypothetical protein [Burkholderia pseudomallei]MBF3830801.1 hypothetical protein [Burkholderia pseudomallei]
MSVTLKATMGAEMVNPNEPSKPYSHVIDNLVKHGDTDWFGGEEGLVPDEVEIGPKDMGGITAIAFTFNKEISDVTKDVIRAAELEVESVRDEDREQSDVIASIIAREERGNTDED